MPVRVLASELYKITEEDLREAITMFREGALPETFEDSTRFDLLIDGYRRFPPKVIIALAAKRPLGRVLSSDEFSGGETSTAFRLILARGFELTTKIMRVAGLDATFSAGRNKESAFVLFESRGPDRNTQYVEGLEALLRGLADLDASIEDIVIDSMETRELSVAQRRLDLRNQSYPFRLRDVKDMTGLRRNITRAAAATGRGPDAAGSDNPTKRLRLIFSEPEDLDLFGMASFLAQTRAVPGTMPREFVFRARAPAPSGGETDTRRAVEETDVTHIHYQMQVLLYSDLVATHGPDSVSCEGATASGRPADILVRLPDGYELFEIKTALAPRDCVRQALGQLLEYAYWPGSPYIKALWIVGPSSIENETETEKYLHDLRERFGLPLGYRHQPVVAASAHGNAAQLTLGDVPGTEGYTEAADLLVLQYESMSFEQCHEPALHLLPTVPCPVLDVGAGSGRDAAWFADRGHSVLAVEPTAALRTAARVLHPSRSIEWLDDSLPELARVVARNQRFDLILLSAVWMHLDASERQAGMRTLASLLSRNGTLVMSLRHGPLPLGRRMFDVSGEETITIAARNGLRPVLNVRCDSIQASNRAVGVTWTQLAFRR